MHGIQNSYSGNPFIHGAQYLFPQLAESRIVKTYNAARPHRIDSSGPAALSQRHRKLSNANHVETRRVLRHLPPVAFALPDTQMQGTSKFNKKNF